LAHGEAVSTVPCIDDDDDDDDEVADVEVLLINSDERTGWMLK
jgi:hypothetical protein